MIEIKSLWDASTIYSADVESMREALEKAVQDGANLSRANLDGANLDGASLSRANLSRANLDGASLYGANLSRASLYGANLYGANLSRANLDGANLDGASLSRANLDGANLDGASLYGANLYGASLSRANLDGANLSRANLDGANLDGASLYGANLDGANLDGAKNVDLDAWLKPVRDDIRDVLDAAPAEVPGLLAKLWNGEINGTAYQGECACLVGTIANLQGRAYTAIPGLMPNADRPAERWFYRILKGHTPLNNPSAAFVAAVIAHWQHERANAKPRKKRRAAATSSDDEKVRNTR